ncbi:hypothetical protein N7510_001768 [Penicillium lagena]|uniref:uncharacterized protein n=1 Tax=Penicillium lagena TaxID=94218 RepID=UPI002540D1A4|nr:uncharacterized protein N7510_001768 [Penicillium lagena]KAJ5625459.1 hypothetical protein N7510_001768 [Penicillium lagena]
MPWSPTQSFPHPLAIVHHQNCKPTVANFVSYAVVDMMVWEGLGDLINKFRKTALSLDPLDTITAPSLINRLQIPSLLGKPPDWPEKIDICGFSFLPSESDYTPPAEIEAFLRAGPEPIYVGFGSIVVDDQIKLTKIVFEAIKKTGQRALVSKGWGNLGIDDVDVPDNILVIGSCPHDWLFRQVSVVIHHGGAGTTAAGLALGKPTIIIPFFGDQQFWGSIVARAGAGPRPIPHKQLTVDKLSEAIEMALKPSTQKKAQMIGNKMKNESGVRDAARSFHKHLDLQSLRCAICPSRPAVWQLKHTGIKLSAFAGAVLVEMGRVKPEEAVLHRPMEYDTYRDPAGPISAGAQVLFGAIANFLIGLADVPTEIVTDIVSTGRALGHPHDHFDPRSNCRLGRSSPREESESDEEQNEREIEDRMEGNQANTLYEDEQEEAANGDLFDSTLERKDSLRLEKQQTMSSEMEKSKPHNVFSEVAIHGSVMSMKFLNLVIWLPTDLSLSLAKGFHNAPKLYHDPMVKRIPTITGVHSGFRAAGSEFKDGFYYGITGLVTQPRFGYKHSGTKGLFKGVGKGVGGVVFKLPAGLWGLAGYPLAGLRRRLLESIGRSQQCQIIKSRITQGHEEMRASSAEERAEVARRWIAVEEELENARRRQNHLHFHHNGHEQ